MMSQNLSLRLMKYLFVIFGMLSVSSLVAQTISGHTSVTLTSTTTYTYTASVGSPSWSATKGVVYSYSSNGNVHTAMVSWTTSGAGSVTIWNGATALSTLNVTVSSCSIANPSTNAGSRCGTGTVSLNAMPGTGGNTVKWYPTSSGAALLATGIYYTTPSISATTTYYVTSYNTTTLCESPRIPITATVYTTYPSAPTGTNASRCGAGSVTLSGTPGANGTTLRWYTASSGGTFLANGTTYATPSISVTTTYYISSYNSSTGCESSTRVAVTATVKSLPPAPSVAGNTRLGPGTFTLTATGTPGGGSYAWYSPANALLGTGSSYITGIVTTGTTNYIQARTTSNGCESVSTWVDAIISALPVITATSDRIIFGAPVTLDAGAGFSSYLWKNSSGATVGTSRTLVTALPDHYTVTVTKTGVSGTGTSAPFHLKAQREGWDINYVATQSVQVKNVTSIQAVDYLPAEQVIQQINYFDGLGRLAQKVSTQGSPAKHDVIIPTVYDELGREYRKYLPAVPAEQSGAFKAGIINAASGAYTGSAGGFYNNPVAGIPDDGNFPFSETVFENSSLNRVVKQGAFGAPWQPTGVQRYSSDDKTTRKLYEFNGTNEVLNWIYSYPDISYPFGKVNVASTPYYAPNELTRVKTKDEQGNRIIEYLNKAGKLILKRVQAGTDTTVTDVSYASTYYIYSLHGNLAVIIPPQATRLITQTSPVSEYLAKTDIEKDVFMARWAFRYVYDRGNRMAMKHAPGAGAEYLIYDKRDRLVLTQDANQRAGGYWMFTKYDLLNRPILTGIKDTTATREQMQNVVDTYYDPTKAWRTYGETFTGTGPVHGYSNTSYPRTTSPGTLDANRFLTVSYYDTYTFKNLWPGSYNYADENLTQTVNGATYNQPDAAFAYVKGQMTGTKVKVLDGGVAGGLSWLKSANYYDDHYRVIQSITDNYKQGIDTATTLYDFAGKILRTQSIHSQYDVFWKDATPGIAQSGERLYRSAGGSDNNEGAASAAMLPAYQDGWFEFTYSNANTLYIGLSDANPDTNPTTIDYGIRVGGSSAYAAYMGTGTPTTIGSHVLGDVFRIERKAGIIKVKRNGAVEHTFPGSSNGALLVDISFYSGQSSVLFARASFSSGNYTVSRTFDYDHSGRLINTWHRLDQPGATGTEILLSRNTYNEVGQLIDKKLHSTVANGSDARQSVDYRYNIRGWLTQMNDASLNDNTEGNHDLFGMELLYNETSDLANVPAFNGNVTGMKWSNNLGLDDVTQNAYTYRYDAMNRITGSTYRQKDGSWAALSNGRFTERELQYDLNSNISRLVRNDGRTSGWMDSLAYEYTNDSGVSQGNQLMKVTDHGDDYAGFMDGTNPGSDYAYDLNGNMKLDYNKGITTAITYNYLNLPELITRGGGTNLVRYIYDATGHKLAQVLSLTGPPKRTDYTGEFIYENDVAQQITHEEGRVLLVKEEKILAFDGTHQNDITPTANVTLTHETFGEETYLKVTASSGSVLTGHGISTIGGSFPVVAGERYAYRVKGYRTSQPVHLYIKSNAGNLIWPAAQLTEAAGHRNDVWVETIFTIPAGISSIQLALQWNSALTTSQSFSINELELIRLSAQAPEYQYNLKDHLGNIRLTFTAKEQSDTYTATFETSQAAPEDSDFSPSYDQVTFNSASMYNHTAGGTRSQRLSGANTNEIVGLAKSIRVMPGDVVNLKAYAKYAAPTATNTGITGTMLAAAIASSFGLSGASTGEALQAYTRISDMFTSGGMMIGPGDWEDDDAPKAYLNFILFDADFMPYDMGWDQIDEGSTGTHDELALTALVRKPGYIYVYLSNENDKIVDIFFDDLTIEHQLSPVVQQNDYYPFGLTFNSSQREDSKGNAYLFNGKEKQDELDLGWMDYGARMYMPEIGRWGVPDPHAGKYESVSPYAYAFNNPLLFVDPTGKDNNIYVLVPEGESEGDVRRLIKKANLMLEKLGLPTRFQLYEKKNGAFSEKKIGPKDTWAVVGKDRNKVAKLAQSITQDEQFKKDADEWAKETDRTNPEISKNNLYSEEVDMGILVDSDDWLQGWYPNTEDERDAQGALSLIHGAGHNAKTPHKSQGLMQEGKALGRSVLGSGVESVLGEKENQVYIQNMMKRYSTPEPVTNPAPNSFGPVKKQ